MPRSSDLLRPHDPGVLNYPDRVNKHIEHIKFTRWGQLAGRPATKSPGEAVRRWLVPDRSGIGRAAR